jgi:preprotein translocase subunit YajC
MSGQLILAQDAPATATPSEAAPTLAEAPAVAEPINGTKVAEPIAGNGGADDQQPGGFQPSMLLMMGVMLVFVYLIMFRPQKKQEKKRREMLSAMKKNDHVVTIGGVHGVIYSVDESDVVLKIDERNDVRIRVEKTHIGRVLTDEENQAAR